MHWFAEEQCLPRNSVAWETYTLRMNWNVLKGPKNKKQQQ